MAGYFLARSVSSEQFRSVRASASSVRPYDRDCFVASLLAMTCCELCCASLISSPTFSCGFYTLMRVLHAHAGSTRSYKFYAVVQVSLMSAASGTALSCQLLTFYQEHDLAGDAISDDPVMLHHAFRFLDAERHDPAQRFCRLLDGGTTCVVEADLGLHRYVDIAHDRHLAPPCDQNGQAARPPAISGCWP